MSGPRPGRRPFAGCRVRPADRTSSRIPVPVLVLAALAGCGGSLNLTPSDHATVLARQTLEADHPGRPGPYEVRRLYYGSGTDRRRPEFRDSVTIRTDPVDASQLVDLGEAADERNDYWGFTPEAFPINGRVWHPAGEGPFPLVLIVHGNHDPTDFSDPGYGYLGELMASRGYIFVSVDMNFINGTGGENDGRGWLLLKHLAAWREFGATEKNPFHGKVDLDRIALIGHSRGGEAVGHAAAFNHLDRYPDDASLEFDFGFGIRSIIAIAPVDGQYMPTGRLVPVENVDYMVFHGSHDGDVTSFHGLRLYHRIAFTDGADRFKAAIYMYRANHGQWNTVWGSADFGPRSERILELGGLIDPEDQREMARIYVSAFLEATLRDRDEYLPIFRDHRVIGGWLPKTMYVTRFQTSAFRPLATFEEDIDVTSGTADGVTLRGDSLGRWREDRLDLRSRNRPTTPNTQGSNAVWLGWNDTIEGDEEATAAPASYAIELPPRLAAEWDLGPGSTLDFLLGALDEVPEPRASDEAGDAADGGTEPGEAPDGGTEPGEAADRGTTSRDVGDGAGSDEGLGESVDLTVQVTDASGVSGRVRLSVYGPIRKPLGIRVRRRNDAESFDAQWELVLQSFSIPLGDFVGETELDLRALREIRLVFDITDAGTVVIDEIGLSNLKPAFLGGGG